MAHRNTVPAVRIVRESVSFTLLLMICGNVLFLSTWRFSRIRSKTTIVALIE